MIAPALNTNRVLMPHEPLDTVNNEYARGLLAWYRMVEGEGERVEDWAGNNHGRLVNGPTWVPGPDGRGAVSFDGNDDAIRLPFARLTVPLTIVTSIYLESATDYQQVFSNWNSTSADLYIDTGDGAFRWAHDQGSGSNTAGSVVTEVWTHVAMTIDGTHLTAYIDGAQVGQWNDTNTDDIDNSEPFWFGTHNLSAINLNGHIEYGGIYSTALFAKQIRALHADPDLPIWRPRAGVSLAGLAVPTGRPRTFSQHRHGPRLVIGGST